MENPLTALKADGETLTKPENGELRRLRSISVGRATFAAAPSDWDSAERRSLSEEDRSALHQLFADTYDVFATKNPGGHNRPTRDDVVGWSEAYPDWSFFYQADEGEPIEEFVAGEPVED